MFKCLWNLDMNDDDIENMCGPSQLTPLQLLNTLRRLKLNSLFPNVCIAIRLFWTITVTTAEAERSSSKMNDIKNVHRSTMSQERMSGLMP
ncbi:hypothetical protein PR048_014795 [Dryococelus australis]|uniref:HAT C-terminal dimerisation domain-containing protein n=1 Tax=Dryococelus australis TaxID=614101 RepID=A0ABQ9HF61_9NEOP|nr:hypothetical protein PR048_014795 [Dryococelus australis]